MCNLESELVMASAVWRAAWPPPGVTRAHVWAIALDSKHHERIDMTELTPAERVRAARYHRPLDRARWIAGRVALRRILGAYLSQLPGAVALDYGPAGKPHLVDGNSKLFFNLAHSEGRALLAVHSTGPVGIDLEYQRDLPELAAMASLTFSTAEYAAWRMLPEPQRVAGFYRCWTSKEAVVKALGLGLGADLSAFDVAVDPNASAAILAERAPFSEKPPLYLVAIPVGAGWIATLALPMPTGAPPLLVGYNLQGWT